MGERTLRGARLGGQSFEDERGIEFAARQNVGYACPQGHEFEIPMSVEADVPAKGGGKTEDQLRSGIHEARYRRERLPDGLRRLELLR